VRDPQGTVLVTDDEIVRNLNEPLPADHFLFTRTVTELVDAGYITSFHFIDKLQIRSPRIPFVTYPHEWCAGQIKSAAVLTLKIAETILPDGYELKDASAWNIIFEGCKPKFCDHLSFQRIERRQWWAFGQFVRHFIFPLALFKLRGLHCHELFKIYRDGPTPEFFRALLGARRFLTRYWLLTIGSGKSTKIGSQIMPSVISPAVTHHNNLYATARWFLPSFKLQKKERSAWAGYVEHRAHYKGETAKHKFVVVQTWLQELTPRWVTDLGCNTGEFSMLAAKFGASVVALDSDHDCIRSIYESCHKLPIYPVIASLDDLCGGRGWEGTEVASLLSRLEARADVLMMLALLHHLMITCAIPINRIVEFASKLTKQFLIIELISEEDPLLIDLCHQRCRHPEEFSLSSQMHAMETSFVLLKKVELDGGTRTLSLYRKR
jgi:hypothetical protein